jgi:hypothetical protein
LQRQQYRWATAHAEALDEFLTQLPARPTGTVSFNRERDASSLGKATTML